MLVMMLLLIVALANAQVDRCCCEWKEGRECLPGFPAAACGVSGFSCKAPDTPAPTTAAPTAAPLQDKCIRYEGTFTGAPVWTTAGAKMATGVIGGERFMSIQAWGDRADDAHLDHVFTAWFMALPKATIEECGPGCDILRIFVGDLSHLLPTLFITQLDAALPYNDASDETIRGVHMSASYFGDIPARKFGFGADDVTFTDTETFPWMMILIEDHGRYDQDGAVVPGDIPTDFWLPYDLNWPIPALSGMRPPDAEPLAFVFSNDEAWDSMGSDRKRSNVAPVSVETTKAVMQHISKLITKN